MRKQIAICDKCGVRLPDYPKNVAKTYRRKFVIWRILGSGPYDYWERDYDLCDKCHAKMIKWLEGDFND